MTTWKERLENNPVIYFLGVAITSYGLGFGSYATLEKIWGQSPEQACTQQQWSAAARNADWLPRSLCPAYPVSVALLSPGNGTIVSVFYYGSYKANVELVIKASRPIPEASAVGLVAHVEGDQNYYLIFPDLSRDETRTIFRETQLEVPLYPANDSQLQLWAVLVDNKGSFGSTYGSLEQIKSSSAEVTLSPMTTLTAKR
jgi:hypothetical protein